MRELRLRTSLVLLLVTASTLTFTIVGSLLLIYRLPQIESAERSRLHLQARANSRVVDGITDGLESQIKPLARLMKQLGSSRIQPYLEAFVGEGDTVQALFIVGPEGNVEALGLPRHNHAAMQELRGVDFSQNHLFRQLQRRPPAEASTVIWSDEYLSSLSGKKTVALAVKAESRLIIAEISLERLLSLIRLTENSALTVVSDRRGQWLAATGTGELRFHNFGNLESFQALERGRPLPERQYFQGTTYLIGGAISPKLGWIFLTASPAGMGNESYRITVIMIVAAFFGALAINLLLAPFWATSLARPLRDLVARAQAAASGDYQSAWPGKGVIREINLLATDLGHMVSVIRAREEATQRSEERLLATLESTPSVSIQWFDRQGRVLFWNHASERFYGISRGEAMGVQAAADTLLMFRDEHQVADFLALLQKVEATGQPIGPLEFPLHDKTGQTVIVLATIFSIPGDDGEPIFVCMDVDITELRQVEYEIRQLNAELEERVADRTEELSQANDELSVTIENLKDTQAQLIQSEKLAALGNLVAGIAHELNTPIGNGVMAVSTLRERLEEYREESAAGLRRSTLDSFINSVASGSDIAFRNLVRAAELIRSFKQVAVDQTSECRRQFKLASLVDEILMTLTPTLKRTPYVVDTDIPGDISLNSFPGPLGQAITNLVNNAIQHGFDGRAEGCIRISAVREDPGHIYLRVHDNGNGIPEESLPRIFEPFFTTKMGRGGTGLGLHVVHNIVCSMLGGSVKVTSAAGQWTEFLIQLPEHAPTSEAERSQSPPYSATDSA